MARKTDCLILYRDDIDPQHINIPFKDVNKECFPGWVSKFDMANVVIFVNTRGEDRSTMILKNRFGMFGNVVPLRVKQKS